MSITVHQRPGVYSSYDASAVVSGRGSGRMVGLVGLNPQVPAGTVQVITSYDKAVAAFGSGGPEGMAELIRLALKNGASGVAVAPVSNANGYEAAFALLAGQEDIALVLCDSTDTAVQKKLLDSVAEASELRRERLCVVAGAKDESVDNLIQRAKEMNHERVVLAAPGCVDGTGKSISGLPLAAALAVNNAGIGVAAGVAGIGLWTATAGNFIVTLFALHLGRFLGLRMAGRFLGRYALPLSGLLLVLLGLWQAMGLE